MKTTIAVLLFSLAAALAGAQDPAVPSPAPPPQQESAVKLSLSAATSVALGRPATSVRYFVQGDIQGPLVVGNKAVGDISGSATVETLPAKSQDAAGTLTDLSTWGNVLQLDGVVGRRIGDAMFGTQHVSTSIVLNGGVATAFFDSVAEPQRKRFYRTYGVGVQVTLHLPERDSFFRIGYCRDEAVGARGIGQICVAGELPVIKGVRLYGHAGLGLGAASTGGEQVDYVVLGLGKPF